MTSDVTPEVVDLRGRPSPEQMQAAQAAIERAAEVAITLLSELEVIPKFVLPAAAERGLRCRMEPPQQGEWRVTLSPSGRASEAPGSNSTGQEGGM